ncbi:MAG: pilin [Pseudomonadota bacterium]
MNKQTLQALLIATDLSQRLRSAIDFGAAVTLLMLLSAIAVGGINHYVAQAQLTEAFMLSTTVKGELITYRAQHGHWPPADAQLPVSALRDPESLGNYVDTMALGGGGALTSTFQSEGLAQSIQGRRLTLRPLVSPYDSSAPVAWVCGANRHPEPLTPSGNDETNIEPEALPSICRND